MRGFRLGSIFTLIAVFGFGVQELRGQSEARMANRMRVGLVLSGGGARGFAHLGVLRGLEEMRVPIDFIIGTSMGSVVGGLYASGLSLEELEAVVLETDWEDIFDDAPPRDNISFRRKSEQREDLFDFELGVGRDGIKVGSGLIAGKKLGPILRGMTLHVGNTEDFDQLPIPFRAVATDLVNGDPVVMGKGDLANAMRASMAVPGVFPAVEIEGRHVVDGGLVSNLPVEIIRNFGVDVVIAVDITTPPATNPETGSLVEVAVQSIDILTYRNVVRSIGELGADDVLISPELGELGAIDFDKQAEFIARGYAAVNEARSKLRNYAISPAEFKKRQDVRRISPSDYIKGVMIDQIEIEGLKRHDPRLVNARLKTRPGRILDLDLLRQDLFRIEQLGEFDDLGYRFYEEDGKTKLVIRAIEDPRGPGYLQFGLKLSSSLNGKGEFTMYANYRRTAVNKLGGEWKTAGSFGEVDSVYTELYQPLHFAGKWFTAPRFGFYHNTEARFLEGHSQILGDTKTAEGRVDFGRVLGNHGEIRLGVYGGKLEASSDLESFETRDVDLGGMRIGISIDSMDGAHFPRYGFLGSLEARLSRENLGADDVYDKVSFSLTRAQSVGSTTFLGAMELNTNLGTELPYYDVYQLGGLFRLSGLEENALQGKVSGLVQLAWYHPIVELPAMLGGNLYMGLAFEGGNVWSDIHAAELGDLNYGFLGFLGADTALGPVFLGYGQTEGESSWHLRLGRIFD